MTVRDTCPAVLAFQGTAANAHHLRVEPVRRAIDSLDRLLVNLTINEDELFRIEIKLLIESFLPLLQQARTFLLQCMCGPFLIVQPRERSQELSADRPIFTARSSARRILLVCAVSSHLWRRGRSSGLPSKR